MELGGLGRFQVWCTRKHMVAKSRQVSRFTRRPAFIKAKPSARTSSEKSPAISRGPRMRVSASAMRMVHVPRSETKGEMRYSPSVSFSLERSSFTSRRCLELFATSFKSKASSRRLRFDTTTRSTTPSNVLVLTAS